MLLFFTFPTSLLTSKASISSDEKAQEVDGGAGRIGVAVEPAVEVSGVEDDRHAVVDRSHQFVRVGGDDGYSSATIGRSQGPSTPGEAHAACHF